MRSTSTRSETLSPAELVRNTGFGHSSDEVTIERLMDCLAKHPEWLNAWLTYSQDRRSSPGWYIQGRDATAFRVGYYEGPSSRPPAIFEDKVRACAEYVRAEVLDIASPDLSDEHQSGQSHLL